MPKNSKRKTHIVSNEGMSNLGDFTFFIFIEFQCFSTKITLLCTKKINLDFSYTFQQVEMGKKGPGKKKFKSAIIQIYGFSKYVFSGFLKCISESTLFQRSLKLYFWLESSNMAGKDKGKTKTKQKQASKSPQAQQKVTQIGKTGEFPSGYGTYKPTRQICTIPIAMCTNPVQKCVRYRTFSTRV